MTPLQQAILMIGTYRLAKALGITHPSVYKWKQTGYLPRTEWTGETKYAPKIARLVNHRVTRAQLLKRPHVPPPTQQPSPE